MSYNDSKTINLSMPFQATDLFLNPMKPEQQWFSRGIDRDQWNEMG